MVLRLSQLDPIATSILLGCRLCTWCGVCSFAHLYHQEVNVNSENQPSEIENLSYQSLRSPSLRCLVHDEFDFTALRNICMRDDRSVHRPTVHFEALDIGILASTRGDDDQGPGNAWQVDCHFVKEWAGFTYTRSTLHSMQNTQKCSRSNNVFSRYRIDRIEP